MAIKKKIQPKPLNALRHDFVASLDNVVHESIMFLTAVETAARHGKMNETTREVLEERAAAFRKALFEPLLLNDDGR